MCNPRRFGSKLDAVALLQEWVRDVGSQAGLTSDNTQLHTGRQATLAGAPESRLMLVSSFPHVESTEGLLNPFGYAQH